MFFTLYLREISKYIQAPAGGLYLEGRFNGGFFVMSLGGLYLAALTRGRAYFQNFTVFDRTIETIINK